MTHSETDQMADIRVPIGVGIVLQAIIAAAYIIPIESDPALSTESRFRFLEAVLYLSPLLTLALYHWRPQVGRWFAVLAPAVIVFALQSWLPIPGSLTLLAIATGLAATLIGTRAAVGVAIASVLGLVALRAVTGAYDGWQTGIAFIAIATTLILTISRAARDGRRCRVEPPATTWRQCASCRKTARHRVRCSRHWTTWRMPTGRWRCCTNGRQSCSAWPRRRNAPSRHLWPRSATSSARRST